MPRAIVDGLKSRGADLVTSYEDGTNEFDDSKLLDRATELGRALFTRDYDLLQEATKRQRSGVRFSGVIYAHQLRVSVGSCIRDLEIIAKAGESKDIENRVEFLPL